MFVSRGRRQGAAMVLVALLTLAGCGNNSDMASTDSALEECDNNEICGAATSVRVRSIKGYVVTQVASGVERRFSGEVLAANEAPLSFSVGGQVLTIGVAAGDAAVQGALLATLDSAPFEINVETARAEVSAAQAAERALATDLARQRELKSNGWVSQAALDQAEVEYENATSQVSVAQSRLALAQRDLASTRMLAPFSGVISSVAVDPFSEVAPGQVIMVLQSGDAFEVVVSVPETVVAQLTIGSPVAVEVATLPLCGCLGRIVEIGAVSSSGNAVDVVVAVTQAPKDLRVGMSAEVGLTLGGNESGAGYFIPFAAIAPGEGDQSAFVYRFDADEGVVRQTRVRLTGSVASEAVAVEGLEAGDIIAAAGVSFLRDGQSVRLLGQAE